MSSQNKAAVEIYPVSPLIKDCLLKLHSFLLLISGQSRMNNMFVFAWRDAKFKDRFWLIKLVQAISQKSCLLLETKRNWFNPESTCCSVANFILKHIQDKWERRQMAVWSFLLFLSPLPGLSAVLVACAQLPDNALQKLIVFLSYTEWAMASHYLSEK